MYETENSAKTHWPVHPLALLFPPKAPQERAEMKRDMQERVARGLDPLESALLLYEGKLLDGRHRDELWCELAVEGACDGYFARNQPRTETFSPDRHGTLGAWLRAKSRNLMVRQIPADQRGAIFLKAVEAFPEIKAVIDQIEEENLQRQKEGKPLDAGDQRGNTAEQVAGLAGVGATTIKLLKKLQKDAPDQFEAVAEGRVTAKKALKEVEQGEEAVQQGEGKQGDDKSSEADKGLSETGQQPRKELQVGPGDPVYEVERVAGRPTLIRWEVRSVDTHSFLCVGNKRLHRPDAFTLEEAKAERLKRLRDEITDLKQELRGLKAEMKKEPTVVAGAKKLGNQTG
jgi:hypothetical protein